MSLNTKIDCSQSNNNTFNHLKDRKPEVFSILKTPVDFVSNEHLKTCKTHFVWIQEKYHFDKGICEAAWVIISKIDKIFHCSNVLNSSEITKASNDEYYKRGNLPYKKAA